jgi:hypothetical protein
MSWTKRQFISQAFHEIGLASYVFDLSPEQLNTALLSLDSMMASWNAKGIRVGYPLSSNPESADIASDTGVPDAANEAIYLNLALRLAPAYGKTVSPDTKFSAMVAYQGLISKVAKPIEKQYDGMLPVGAGNKDSANFMNTPAESLDAGGDSTLTFE